MNEKDIEIKQLKKELELAWHSYDIERERAEKAIKFISDLCEKVPDEYISLSDLIKI